jgi:hypothetical protein
MQFMLCLTLVQLNLNTKQKLGSTGSDGRGKKSNTELDAILER